MKNLFIILLSIGLLFSCSNSHNHKHKVQTWKQTVTHDDGSTDLLFWYIMMSGSNSSPTYYYYSSPTPVTNFSSVSWQISESNPADKIEEKEELPEQEIENDQLSEETQGEIEADSENSDSGSATDDNGGSDSDSGGGDSGGGDGDGGDGGGD